MSALRGGVEAGEPERPLQRREREREREKDPRSKVIWGSGFTIIEEGGTWARALTPLAGNGEREKDPRSKKLSRLWLYDH